MHVIEQASKNGGETVTTKFDNGSKCVHNSNGSAQYYSAPNARGITRRLYPEQSGKLIEKMNTLATKGVR